MAMIKVTYVALPATGICRFAVPGAPMHGEHDDDAHVRRKVNKIKIRPLQPLVSRQLVVLFVRLVVAGGRVEQQQQRTGSWNLRIRSFVLGTSPITSFRINYRIIYYQPYWP
jgi:hypothetical protein